MIIHTMLGLFHYVQSDDPPTLLSFHAYVRNQFQLPLLAFQTDNGKEFDNFALRSFLANNGIALRLSCPYTSAQNGKA